MFYYPYTYLVPYVGTTSDVHNYYQIYNEDIFCVIPSVLPFPKTTNLHTDDIYVY